MMFFYMFFLCIFVNLNKCGERGKKVRLLEEFKVVNVKLFKIHIDVVYLGFYVFLVYILLISFIIMIIENIDFYCVFFICNYL